ncbi:flagellar filament capping protein FliD [Dyella sp. LX-66]|uniref:flagellar filament capping protein FliD n=1 Tax=unclassified Dyella TaxID=2634549 RepID=UPI001BDFF6D1|nr:MULTISPECIES: flagellar filament capping protein FliD [unclassified Dyella]MBT2115997.1 flagellar filament capping protein FliD [Dyella sp. LX-1]MBT2138007.1 flagellar filament capping protein FliD [Dyella sp. LX-66]
MAITTSSTSSSTGPLTAAGVGSGLDVNGLVSQLVAAKKKPLQDQIDSQTSTAKTQISALGQVSSALAALQTALKGLSDGTSFQTRKAATSDASVFSVTSTTGAMNGSYNLNVSQLATALKVQSAGVASSDAKVGTGTLTIGVGSKSMSIDIGSDGSSLSQIRDAINKSSGNPGVTATIVTGSDGAHLVLSSTATGQANAFTVSSSGGDGGLAALNYNPASSGNGMSVLTAAQDAKFTIDGMAATSASNTVTGAIDGITLSLWKPGTATLSVSTDSSAASTAVGNFVTAYNNFVGMYQSLTAYDPTGANTGALIGDATLNSIKSTLSSIVSGPGGNGAMLNSIGVTLQIDGTLKLDTGALSTALSDGGTKVSGLFSGTGGMATQLNSPLTDWTASTGVLTTRTNNLNKQLKDLGTRQDNLNSDMDALTTQYTKRFTALDTLLTKLNSTSSYLTQQFDALTKSSK